MKKKTIKLVKEIINKEFLTDWEFIVEVIAPEIEEEEFDADEVSEILAEEILKRKLALNN